MGKRMKGARGPSCPLLPWALVRGFHESCISPSRSLGLRTGILGRTPAMLLSPSVCCTPGDRRRCLRLEPVLAGLPGGSCVPPPRRRPLPDRPFSLLLSVAPAGARGRPALPEVVAHLGPRRTPRRRGPDRRGSGHRPRASARPDLRAFGRRLLTWLEGSSEQ